MISELTLLQNSNTLKGLVQVGSVRTMSTDRAVDGSGEGVMQKGWGERELN